MNSKIITGATLNTFNNKQFKDDFKQLLLQRLNPTDDQIQLSEIQIKRLVETAGLFALHEDGLYQRIAFKIIVFLLEIYKIKYKPLPYLVQLILSRMGDLPTIQYMIEREDGKDFFAYFEHQYENNQVVKMQFPEVMTTKVFNQVTIGGKRQSFTDFQTKVFRLLHDRKNISCSAPTSAGKSFVVLQYIADKILREHWFCALYIVPTKALIKEIQDDIALKLKNVGITLEQVSIFNSVSHMNIKKINNTKKKILVMTQERLQQMLTLEEKIPVDLLVVDEAQKVGDENRGVIIEDAVQELMNTTILPIQTVFISPNTRDPGKFKDIFNIKEDIESFRTTKTPVGQNFFDIIFDRENKQANVSLVSQELEEKIPLYSKPVVGKFDYKAIAGRKAWIVNNIVKRKEPTLIYCDTRVACRQVCEKIIENQEDVTDPEKEKTLSNAIDFIKEHVHEEYYLLDYLRKGVGYHYGRMPHFVRLVIKELFENKAINDLCCTSTLLEGVNLPAKNIVLFNPKLGLKIFMNKSGIRNLAGRAGRLSKDYYGNIYCIDRKDWEFEDAFDGELEDIKGAMEKALSNNIEEIIKYLDDPNAVGISSNVQVISISLIMKWLNDPVQFDKYVKIKCPDILISNLDDIKLRLNKLSSTVESLDSKIIFKNKTIDPRFQHELYNFLKKQRNLILPPDPLHDNFHADLLVIFRNISQILLREMNESYEYYAGLGAYWIWGRSYKQLLDNKIANNVAEENETQKEFINRMIEKHDDDLERELKFTYAKGLQCYCDIVAHILKQNKDERKYCTDLPEYLEAGASSPLVFTLLDLGLSRITALLLYKEMDENIKEPSECINWLIDNDALVHKKLGDILYEDLKATALKGITKNTK